MHKRRLSIAALVPFAVIVGLLDLFVTPELMNHHSLALRLLGFGFGATFLAQLVHLAYRIVDLARTKMFVRDHLE